MERHLNLIKTDYKEVEKRILPRFPFTYLVFKEGSGNCVDEKFFEVSDISFTGMQLILKDGGHGHSPGDKLTGILRWRSAELETKGKVKWVEGARIGIKFDQNDLFKTNVREFLSIDNIIAGMRPLHDKALELELPVGLKYWLCADGPVEIFIWQHNDGELARFQMILMERLVEWEDGHGVRTGRVLSKRDVDTPLLNEDEFMFQIDEDVDQSDIEFAGRIISKIPKNFLPIQAIEFLKLKLRGA